jgi:hypothetical protein
LIEHVADDRALITTLSMGGEGNEQQQRSKERW